MPALHAFNSLMNAFPRCCLWAGQAGAMNELWPTPHLCWGGALGAILAFTCTLLDAACLVQWGFAGHHPALAALCSVCIQGKVDTAAPAVCGLHPPNLGL